MVKQTGNKNGTIPSLLLQGKGPYRLALEACLVVTLHKSKSCLPSLPYRFSANFKSSSKPSPRRVKFPGWPMRRVKQLEVKGKKKTVSHLINGLNLISGKKLKSDSVWLGQAPGPFLQNCKMAKGWVGLEGWPFRDACCFCAVLTGKLRRSLNRQVGDVPSSWWKGGFRVVNAEVFENEKKFWKYGSSTFSPSNPITPWNGRRWLRDLLGSLDLTFLQP